MSTPPENPKIYHIVHWDCLKSIVSDGYLHSDAVMGDRPDVCTTIGIRSIKGDRREKELDSHSGLKVGDCVPFYFAPRSVMLYVIHKDNHLGLHYHGGQGPVVHLEADLNAAVQWASRHNRRWAFTTANAAARFTADYANLERLDQVDWEAVNAEWWSDQRDAKQAEFLMETSFPWPLIERVGVRRANIRDTVRRELATASHQPPVEVMHHWYY